MNLLKILKLWYLKKRFVTQWLPYSLRSNTYSNTYFQIKHCRDVFYQVSAFTALPPYPHHFQIAGNQPHKELVQKQLRWVREWRWDQIGLLIYDGIG